MEAFRDSARLLQPEHKFLLGVLGAASFFEGYDFNIVAVALPQIRETFGLSQQQASLWIGLLFLGALPAIFITRWSDKHGRKRLLLVSIVGYTVATGATAVAPSMSFYVGCQFVARLFLAAEGAIVWTMVTEELPAGARGLGFGWLAMLNAFGTGTGAVIYAVALAPFGFSWRWLYVIAVPPLLAMSYLRRRLPESRRFVEARDSGQLAGHWHEILRRPHRRWLILICTTAFLGSLATQAGFFLIDYMQTDRGLSPSLSNLMLVGAGVLGIPVLIFAGALSDRLGRKVVGCSFASLGAVGSVGFFFIPGGAPVLFAMLFISLVGQFGAWPTLNAFGTELFPTALRGQASAWATVFRVTGQFASFMVAGVLIARLGGLPKTVLVLGIGPVITIFLIAIFFPETKGRELEEITADEVGLAGGLGGAAFAEAYIAGEGLGERDGSEPAAGDD